MILCVNCRYPDVHKCTFDYQKDSREKLTKDNPVIVSEKLNKI